jgi:Arc/MetJ family transcription regulator
MRTNVDLDDALVEEAFRLTGVRTKKRLLHLALEELIRARGKRNLAELAGAIRFADGFDHKEARRVRAVDRGHVDLD